MDKLTISTILLLSCLFHAEAQTHIHLEMCRTAAREAENFKALNELLDQDRRTGEEQLKKIILPDFSGYAQSSYQTDVPNPVSLTDFPFETHTVSNFQYHFGFLVQQNIYSGGSYQIQKDLHRIDNDISQLDLDTKYLALDNTVDDLFFGIIIARSNEKILDSQLQIVDRKLADLRLAFEQGLVFRKTILEMEAERLKSEASLTECRSECRKNIALLSTLIGKPLSEHDEFVLPSVDRSDPVADPSLTRLELENQRISQSKKMAKAATLPHLGLFGIVGYGQWPLNFFSRTPSTYGIAGLHLTIPLTDWRDTQKKQMLLNNAAQKITYEKMHLERRRELEDLRYDNEIARYDSLMDVSARTVALYQELSDELGSMSALGESPVSEYIVALSKLTSARQHHELYSILKLKLRLQRKRYILSQP